MAGKTFSVAATARPEAGFYRCGVYWAPSETIHDGFTEEQFQRLKDEPKLAGVREVPADLKRRGEQAKAEGVEAMKKQIADLERQLEEATKPPPRAKAGDKPSK